MIKYNTNKIVHHYVKSVIMQNNNFHLQLIVAYMKKRLHTMFILYHTTGIGVFVGSFFPVASSSSARSMLPSRAEAPMRNSLGHNQSLPSSSCIISIQIIASCAVRKPPAGFNPTCV
jgi:hypothetical protein